MPDKLSFMKKLIATLFVLALACSPVAMYGQGKLPMKLGLKIAPNIGWMSPGTKGYTSDGARFGGTVGFIGDFYFAENYAFSTGANFQFINGKLNYEDSIPVDDHNNFADGEVLRKYNMLYLEIPVMIKMKTNKFGRISYFGQIGLGTGFRIKAKVRDHVEPLSGAAVDQQYEYNYGTTLIREAIIVGIGCEYHIDESSRIMVGVSYSNSLNNILTGTNNKTHLNEKSQLNFAELNIGFLF